MDETTNPIADVTNTNTRKRFARAGLAVVGGLAVIAVIVKALGSDKTPETV